MKVQHYQLPSVDGNYNNKEFEILNLGDRYIYIWMKTHINYQTKDCFPSYATISEEINKSCEDNDCTPIKVKNAIKRLSEVGWLEITERIGTSNVYTFKEHEKFEMFSKEFLENTKYTWKEKDFYMQLQQYIFKDYDEQKAFISWTNQRLATMLHLSYPTVQRYMNALKRKQAFVEIKTTFKDPDTNLPIIKKEFDLETLKQTFILLKQHDESIKQNTKEINQTKEIVKQYTENVDILAKQVQILTEQMAQLIKQQ